MKKTFEVPEFSRPSLTFEEIPHPSGGLMVGEQYWNAVDFYINEEPKNVVGHYDQLVLVWSQNKSEKWGFHHADVMLFPTQLENVNRYVVTYKRVERIS